MQFKPSLFVSGLAALLVALAPLSAAAAPAPKTAVMVIGGMGSAVGVGWDVLVAALQGGPDVLAFDYSGGTGSYTAADTCQSLATSEANLRREIDALRGRYSHLILIGHSLGGVLAFDVGSGSESDFVSKIVTIDAPLQGLHAWERLIGNALQDSGDCRALDELRSWSLSNNAANWATATATADLARGQQLFIAVNANDLAVDPAAQSIPGVAVNYYLNVVDSGANHSAILHDPASIAQIAQFVAP